MPFTDNTYFNKKGKILERAEGKYYYTEDGRRILDGFSGLWCCNAGHGHPKIKAAITEQFDKMDFAPAFNTSHSIATKFADKILELLPNRGFDKVFFTNCGSTAVDTAMKMSLAYHRANGNGSKTRFIGREKAYHGVGFGGTALSGIPTNRKQFTGNMLPLIDHVSHTHSLEHQAFSRGQPEWGAHLAEDLERLIALHDASTIAAYVMEPVVGSSAVIPPPVGYLERVREICTKHDILLIFDEVITGFGRLGASFATEKFNVTPDMITSAKALTNGVIPCGAVISQKKIFAKLAEAAHTTPGLVPEFFHGYTYSGHPLAMAAGIATIDVFKEEKIFENAAAMAPYFEERLQGLKGLPYVVDTRNCGLMGAVEFQPVPGPVNFGRRAQDVYERCFEKGLLLRFSGTSVPLCPLLTSTKADLDTIFDILTEAINESAANESSLPLTPENKMFVSYTTSKETASA